MENNLARKVYKKLGDYSLNELIQICKLQHGHCERCSSCLRSICNKINFYDLSYFYTEELKTDLEVSLDINRTLEMNEFKNIL